MDGVAFAFAEELRKYIKPLVETGIPGGPTVDDARGAELGGLLYSCGGYNSSGSQTRGMWAFDPSTRAWTQKADIPGDGFYSIGHYVISSGTKLYVGRNTVFLNEYDPSTNSWVSLAKPAALENDSVGASDGTALYVSGDNYHLKYDIATNTWSSIANVGSHTKGVAVYHGGKVHFIGGGPPPNAVNNKYNREYDPATNTVSNKADSPVYIHHAPAYGVVRSRVIVYGGQQGDVITSYDPVRDSWYTYPDGAGIYSAYYMEVAACAINGKLLMHGGSSPTRYVQIIDLSGPLVVDRLQAWLAVN